MEIEWIPVKRIHSPWLLKFNEQPSKAVFELIQAIEQGESPPLRLGIQGRLINDTRNKHLLDAYFRIHLSYLPVERVND